MTETVIEVNEAKEKKPRRARSTHEGGYRWMKGNLYARIQYQDDTGKLKEKLRRVRSGRIKDVWTAVAEMRKELNDHGEETLHADKMTFEELADKYKKAKVFEAIIKDGVKVAGLKSVKPVETYIKIIKEHFGKKLIRSIKPRDIENFRNVRLNTKVKIQIKQREKRLNEKTKRQKWYVTKVTRETERKLSSVNREMATLRRMLNFAVTEGWLIHNPFSKTDKIISNASERARDRVLFYEEENRLLTECKDERAHIKPILICALDTAMRPEEIYKLIWSDVDFDNDIITVRATNTKTEIERIVGITPRLKAELAQLWKASPKNLQSSVFGVKSIKNAFKTACRRAGVEKFRFRDCRHTATTRMVNSGMPQAEIMKVTGHTQLKTFLRYVNLTAKSASANAKFFGAFLDREFLSATNKQTIVDNNNLLN
jgi:integrase